MTEQISIKARWDQVVVPANQRSECGLLLEVSAAEVAEQVKVNKPLNLALVIDASGSMRGDRLAAAKEAAAGICERLGPQDRLSVISFAEDVRVHVAGVAQDKDGRSQALSEIGDICSRGTTNLWGGWIEGATQVANVIDHQEMYTGYVVVLSDGKANQGMTNPRTLAEQAGELAERGITTSAVGIGDDYSPRQLDALAESGNGRLHDAETPEEIVEVVLGELTDVRQIVAKAVEVEIEHSGECGFDVVSRTQHVHDGARITCDLRTLVSGSKRKLPLLVSIPAREAGYRHDVQYRVKWLDTRSGEECRTDWSTSTVEVINPAIYGERTADRDSAVAGKIAWLWVTGLAYEAMRLNESGNYGAAKELLDWNFSRVRTFVEGLSNADEVLATLESTRMRVSRPWKGRSKQEAYVATKKVLRSEREWRRNKDVNWQDKLSQ